MTIDLALRRAELLRLRERILRAAADLAADDEGVGELSSAAGDQQGYSRCCGEDSKDRLPDSVQHGDS